MAARTLRTLAVLGVTVAVLRFLLVRWARSSGLPMGSADQWAPVPRAAAAGATAPRSTTAKVRDTAPTADTPTMSGDAAP